MCGAKGTEENLNKGAIMPTAPVFIKGIGGKVLAGSTEYAILDWNFTKTNTLVEITNSGSAGFAEYYPTKTEGAGSFNALYDSANSPDATNVVNTYGSTSTDFGPDKGGLLEVGSLVTLKLYLGDSGKFYSVPSRIESLAITVNAVADVVKFACTFKSSGVITDPVASA